MAEYPVSMCLCPIKVWEKLECQREQTTCRFCLPSIHSPLWLVSALGFPLGNQLCAMWSWLGVIRQQPTTEVDTGPKLPNQGIPSLGHCDVFRDGI